METDMVVWQIQSAQKQAGAKTEGLPDHCQAEFCLSLIFDNPRAAIHHGPNRLNRALPQNLRDQTAYGPHFRADPHTSLKRYWPPIHAQFPHPQNRFPWPKRDSNQDPAKPATGLGHGNCETP
jgi:hypothetical protein